MAFASLWSLADLFQEPVTFDKNLMACSFQMRLLSWSRLIRRTAIIALPGRPGVAIALCRQTSGGVRLNEPEKETEGDRFAKG